MESIAVYPTQNNVQGAIVSRIAGEDLTGKEGLLAKLASAGMLLPEANTDMTNYVILGGAASGAYADVAALSPERNYRVRLKGTCAKGDRICLADVGTAADIGKVRALPTAAGSYRCFAQAEEAGVDGQLVLVRPCGAETITVSE